ncbi:unnamed protein product [Spirodela intermedia]|uniref:Uncharacterized protein n=1 Tax=Spirodela intermedia TaxID=51605 RepID=A0A7I8JME6_SPIIN|nr:unnamed protein product [Spirodela intermedia]CAA6670985.1 unnamed protein product [Spirodela intermedia]
MSGAPTVRSMNLGESEVRPVLGPAGNKARSISTLGKPASKPLRKEAPSSANDSPPLSPSPSAPSILRRQELLLHSNLSLNASFRRIVPRTRSAAGRIHRRWRRRRLTAILRPPRKSSGQKTCSWVTPNVDPLYAAFHDEEWGVPVHDDKKLFELLILSSALGELTWPAILSKRHIFRELFADFDPVAVSKMSEKKLTAPGSPASAMLSEAKLRATVENARQILKITEELGSFDRYCWGFVNHKPIVSRFRYPRQVPQGHGRRGFRCVGPTVVYSFMQAAGITNDHLIACHRFHDCCAAAAAAEKNPSPRQKKRSPPSPPMSRRSSPRELLQ